MSNPSWYATAPFQSRLYVDDGMLFDIQNMIRHNSNTDTWESVTRGLLGVRSINKDKLGMEGNRGTKHSLIGLDIDSHELAVQLPGAKIDGARALFEQLQSLYQSRAIELQTIQKIRGHM